MKIIKLNSKDIESAINKIRRRQEKDLKNKLLSNLDKLFIAVWTLTLIHISEPTRPY